MVAGFTGSSATVCAGALGSAVAPDPLMSDHCVPPAAPALVVCHNRPRFEALSVTQASAGFAGLNATCLISSYRGNPVAPLMGRLPVMFAQLVPLVVRET